MSGAPRNPDKLNTIGIVVVGVCGAVLVYVSIVALQAFYMSDTSDVQTTADYGGQDSTFKSIKAAQLGNITEYASNTAAPGKAVTFRIPIDKAMELVVDGAKNDCTTSPTNCPASLIPNMPSNQPSVLPIYGRPKPLPMPSPDPSGAGSAAGSAAGSGAGSGSASAGPAAGSAVSAPAPSAATNLAPMVPTGGGAPAPAGATNGTATDAAAHPPTPTAPSGHAP